MKPFEYLRPGSVNEALASLQEQESQALAGGTDLLTLMKEHVVAPGRLVDINRTDLDGDIRMDDDGLRLGTLTTLRQLERHEAVKVHYTALAEAAASAATPQLRNMGTMGGNLCQQPRCWYYRGDFECVLKGDGACRCAAEDADTRFHAIFPGAHSRAVHPSDPAVALAALDARVHLVGPDRDAWVPAATLFRAPDPGAPRMVTVAPGELITEMRIPRPSGGVQSRYFKAMDRAVWAFALVSLAVSARPEAGRLHDLRLVAGGVAAAPRRLTAAEERLEGVEATAERITAAVEASLAGARPTPYNDYKLPLLRGLVQKAVDELVG